MSKRSKPTKTKRSNLNRKTVRHSNGSRTRYEYDADGKCVSTFFDLGFADHITYHYDQLGELLRVVRHRKPKPKL
jgi:hypothetical protein